MFCLGFLYLHKQLLSLDDGFLSLYDADTYDNREDLNIPVFTEIAKEIRAAIENDKAILVRKINV